MQFKDSETAKNLQAAFSGESMARNKYTFFAEAAKREGREDIQQLFENMARNESAHAKILYQYLHGAVGDSAANLNEAMKGEFDEWTSMYPAFAAKAREEGFEDIARSLDQITKIERDHELRFLKALAALKKSQNAPAAQQAEKQVAEKQAISTPGYRCMFCGASFEERPDACSVCGAIGSFESTMINKLG